MKQADVELGDRPGTTSVQLIELRVAKRRIPTLEQEVEVLRRSLHLEGTAAGKMNYPLVVTLPLTESLSR